VSARRLGDAGLMVPSIGHVERACRAVALDADEQEQAALSRIRETR
jgi:hypothetical protein